MAECEVLRCVETATELLRFARPGTPIIETLVCREHFQKIEAGEDFHWNLEDNTIYMDSDLAATGEVVYESFTVQSPDDLGRMVDSLRLVIDGRKRGSGDPARVYVRLTRGDAREIARLLNFFAGGGEEG